MIFAKEPFLLHLLAGSETITALDAAKTLLDSGVHNANEREPSDNLAPLHVAAAWGNIAMCQLLIHYGADVDAQDIDKRRPVDVAAKGECKHFFKRLRKKRRKERSKFARVLAYLFRCAHPTDAVNQSVLITDQEEQRKRYSCPGLIPQTPAPYQQYTKPLPPMNATPPNKCNTPILPSAPPMRRSSSLIREAFLTEDNTGTSEELAVPPDPIPSNIEEEKFDEIELDAVMEDQDARIKVEAIRAQFAHLRLEDLRERLRRRNCAVGPLNAGNRRVYEAKLARLETNQEQHQRDPNSIRQYSSSLQRMILSEERKTEESQRIGLREEVQIRNEYLQSTPKNEVSFFCYLLIDPTKLGHTTNLQFRNFLSAIFYVGKGKRSRPLQHLIHASKCREHFAKSKSTEQSEKLKRILTLWDRGEGVISLHVFYNIHSAEAYVREGAMIDAIGIDNLSNLQRGSFPGSAARWTRKQVDEFGAGLLRKAHIIFQNERCRPIFEADLEC